MPEGGEAPKPVSRAGGETKVNTTKEFSALTPPEKVKAILAGVKEPVSQKMVYDFAGIEPSKLTDEEKDTVSKVFDDPRVQHIKDEKSLTEQYRIDQKKQEEVLQELWVELPIVDLQIAANLLNSLYPDLKSD